MVRSSLWILVSLMVMSNAHSHQCLNKTRKETTPDQNEKFHNYMSGLYGSNGTESSALPTVPSSPLPTVYNPVPTSPLPTVCNPVPTSPLPTVYKPVPTSHLPTVYKPVPTSQYPATTTRPSPHQSNCRCVHRTLCDDGLLEEFGEYKTIDIRNQECDGSYEKKCCPLDKIRPTPFIATTPGSIQCGKRNPEGLGFRFKGPADAAEYGEFPWMVSVVKSQQFVFGGSLIHPQVVLTAAHHIKMSDSIVVKVGEWDTRSTDELYPAQDMNVREKIIHERFYKGAVHNDVALLILDKPVNMTYPNVGLICLPQAGENMDNHNNCVASGWGKDEPDGQYYHILKKVDMPMVPSHRCQTALRAHLGSHFNLHESHVCAGGVPGKDTCKGDGGGPLACPSKDNSVKYVQAGIVAWGAGCGTEVPGLYANVPYLVNWIHDKLASRGMSLDNVQ